MKFVILTGMSGARKEYGDQDDGGYWVLLCGTIFPSHCLRSSRSFSTSRIQSCKRWRSGSTFATQALEELRDTLNRMRSTGVHCEILFLDAEDSVLVKRYKETREIIRWPAASGCDKGIEEERKRLAFLKERADYIIDTSRF